jgi:hypothetical protein
MTHALLAGSPAINFGSNPQSFAVDQRGTSYARVVGGTADIGAFELQSVSGPSLPGDYNRNHVIDATDYVLWRMTLGAGVVAYASADGNGNGAVDAADYGVWRSNFGSSGASGSLSSQVETVVAAIPVQLPHAQLKRTAVSSPSSNNKKPLMSGATSSYTSVDLGLLNLVARADLPTTHTDNSITPEGKSDSSQCMTNDSKFDDAIWETWAPLT